MFTGIITSTGTIKKRTARGLEIAADASFVRKLKAGDSISVNGACLTVISARSQKISADVMSETWSKTMLGKLGPNTKINLELPLKAGAFISGHFVQGHVDGVAKVTAIKKMKGSRIISFKAPTAIARYLVSKGSVAINGISLTITDSQKKKFSVGTISHTWSATMLHTVKKGDLVNIEVDILAKYARKLFSSKYL